MKKTPKSYNSTLRPISPKKQEIMGRESIQTKLLLEQCKGRCMVCGNLPDWRGLQRSHTKKRDRFILVCANCHSPDGEHKYLDETLPLMNKERDG